MKKLSTITWVSIIFFGTLLFEAIAWISQGFSGKAPFRMILLALLFALLLKGVRFIRQILGVLYGLSSLMSIGLVVGFRAKPVIALAFLLIAIASAAAAAFFFRSRTLQSNSKAKSAITSSSSA